MQLCSLFFVFRRKRTTYTCLKDTVAPKSFKILLLLLLFYAYLATCNLFWYKRIKIKKNQQTSGLYGNVYIILRYMEKVCVFKSFWIHLRRIEWMANEDLLMVGKFIFFGFFSFKKNVLIGQREDFVREGDSVGSSSF